VAAYFVTWTQQRPDHPASFDLVLGTWGASTTKQDRQAVALDYRIIEGSPQFMVVDAEGRLAANELADAALKRSEVVGTPLAGEVFALIDAIYLGDLRLTEIKGSI
jgi:NAD(P)H-hydrate repair Nnr-like enzyme with NAD(P)H-hydrate dehydratase domain